MMRFSPLVLLIFLAACMPHAQHFAHFPKSRAVMAEEAFHTADGAVLSSRSWRLKKPRAVIVALHGMNDYSNAFESSGEFFRKHRVALFAYDQRGFGSSPNTGIWAGERNLIGDLKQYIEVLRRMYPGAPVYILGESMGGAVAIVSLADMSFPDVDGVILSAPAVWGAETMNPIYRATLWFAAHTLPFREMSGADLKIVASNNYPMLRALAYDPLIIKKTRVDAIYGMVRLMDSAHDKIPSLKTPVLMLYGGMDQVIPPHAINTALSRFTIPVQYAFYPDGYHMLLRDLQRERVMKDVLSWIKNPDKPLPSGYGKLRRPARIQEQPVEVE